MRGKSAPSVIRAACRSMFFDELSTLREIIWDPEVRAGDKVKAIELLAKYGLGAADQAHIHVHAEAGSIVGVVALPALGEADGVGVVEAADGALTDAVVGAVEVGMVPPGAVEVGMLPAAADDADADVQPLADAPSLQPEGDAA